MSVEQRLSPRRTLYFWALIRRYGAPAKQKVIIKDLSRSGFRIRSSAEYAPGDLIFLEFERSVEAEAWIVRQHDTLPDYGCQFRNPLSQADVDRIAASAINGEYLHNAA